MGALAPVSHWLPQDDLLLKNAIEAGASLESLAKGAVRFSRRFTVQELQDRWYSLLYDPVVSAEASVHMIEFEQCASTAKSNKESKCILGKRKAESVRRCYSAMLKRICNEPFDSRNISFLGGPGYFDAGNSDEPLPADCFFGDEVSNYFGFQESNFGVMNHPFPEVQATGAASSSDGVSASAFCTVLHDNNASKSLNQSCVPQNFCPSFDENIPLTGDQSIVKEFDQSKEMKTCDLFESMEFNIKSSPSFDQINDNQRDVCSGLESKVFNSSPSDCGASLPNFGYPSPIAQIPTWSPGEGLSPSTLADVLEETEEHVGNKLVIPDNVGANNPSLPGFSSVHSKTELKGPMSSDGMKDSLPNAEEYFAELSNSLLNFTTEDKMLFVDASGEDMIDNSYIENLSSLLLDSPGASDTPNLGISEVAVAPQECVNGSPSAAHPGESGDQVQYRPIVWSSEAQKLSSALTVNPAFPELRNGVVFCTLNTEDPEVPNNDDVFLPIRLPSISISSMTNTKFDESYYPMISSVKEFSSIHKGNDGALMKSEQCNYSQLHVASRMTGSSFHSEMSMACQIDDHGVKFEPPKSDTQHVALRNVTSCEGPALVSSAYSNTKNIAPHSGKGLLTRTEQPKNINHNVGDSHLQKHAQSSDSHFRFQNNVVGSEQDIDRTSNIQNHEVLHAELCPAEKTAAETVAIPTVSDPEELSCGSDDDVPYFSDVEAMILDMDLSPDDQDLCYTSGVLKYQHEDLRRTIIRLEEAADAYLQRALSVQGAFAVLYGRRSKHFVKKPEVLLGRATEDVKVDIDLGMEGHANRISRRQATIKMDIDGSFHLTNHGKFSIYVNGKEVIPRENVSLVSGCLIEVRGIPFVFETSRTCIKRYLDHDFGDEGETWEHKALVSSC